MFYEKRNISFLKKVCYKENISFNKENLIIKKIWKEITYYENITHSIISFHENISYYENISFHESISCYENIV